MIGRVIGWLFGGGLDRIMDTIDARVDSETDRQKLRAEIVKEAYRTRPDFMRAGGFILMLIFAIPMAYHAAAVSIYSVHWCADCHAPKEWSIAALPPPFDEWQGAIIMAIFGVGGAMTLFRRR